MSCPCGETTKALGRPTPGPPHYLSGLFFFLLLPGYALVTYLAEGMANTQIATIALRAAIFFIAIYVMRYWEPWRGQASRLYWLLLVGFWCFYGVRVINDSTLESIVLKRPPVEYPLRAFGTCAVSAAAGFVLAARSRVDKTLHLVVLGFLLASAIAAASSRDLLGTVSRARINEQMNPIVLGHLGVSTVLAGIGLILSSSVSILHYAAALASIVTGAVCLALSNSRSPAIALVLGLGLLIASKLGRKGNRTQTILLLGCVLAVLGLALREGFLDTLLVRLERTDLSATGSDTIRLQLWEQAWAGFLDAPLTGSYMELPGFQIWPHNFVLEAFMAAGVMGGVMFLGLLFISVVSLGRIAISWPAKWWICAIYLQYICYSMVSGAIYAMPEYWAFQGAVMGLSEAASTSRRGESRSKSG